MVEGMLAKIDGSLFICAADVFTFWVGLMMTVGNFFEF